MFDERKVEQQAGENSTLNNAGRDIINNNYFDNNGGRLIELSNVKLKRLLKEYQEEKKNPSTEGLSAFIRKLEHFSTNPQGDILDLEEKLKRGGRELDSLDALNLKEEYTKYLHKNKFSKSIQQIHAYLLANVQAFFVSFVIGEIRREGATYQSVNDVIHFKVIIPLINHIEDGNFDEEDDIYIDEVRSMIYYLTGKCHLKWE